MSHPIIFCSECRPGEAGYNGLPAPAERGPLPKTCSERCKKRRQRRLASEESEMRAALGPYVYDDRTGEFIPPNEHTAAALVDDYGREAHTDEIEDAHAEDTAPAHLIPGPPIRALRGEPPRARTLTQVERDDQYRERLGVERPQDLPRRIGRGGATDPDKNADRAKAVAHLPEEGWSFEDRWTSRKFYENAAKETRRSLAPHGEADPLDAT